MRKLALIFLASVALFSSACGGGGDKNDDASAGVNANAGINSNAAAAAAKFADVCASRAAVNMGAAYSAAAQQASNDYSKLVEGLKAAANAAPSELKDDYQVLVGAEVPFFEVLVKANGNYMAAAQDPNFASAAQKMQDPKVQTAAKNISDWFASNCKG